MAFLSPEVLSVIFSFSEGYNFVHRQVCSEFRALIPFIHHLVYLDSMLGDGKKLSFRQKKILAIEALERGLLHLLEANKNYIPLDACDVAAKGGRQKILQWLLSQGYKCTENTCSVAAEGGHLKVLQYLRVNGWFHGT